MLKRNICVPARIKRDCTAHIQSLPLFNLVYNSQWSHSSNNISAPMPNKLNVKEKKEKRKEKKTDIKKK